jgi:hypothetical protein
MTVALVPTVTLESQNTLISTRERIDLGVSHEANFGTFEITSVIENTTNHTIAVAYNTFSSNQSERTVDVELVGIDGGSSDDCDFTFISTGPAGNYSGICVLGSPEFENPSYLLVGDQHYLDLESVDLVAAPYIELNPTMVASPSPVPTPTPTPNVAATPSPTPTATPVFEGSLMAMHSWRTGDDLEHQKLWLQYEIGSIPRELPASVGTGELRVSPDRQNIAQLFQDGLEIYDNAGNGVVEYATSKTGLKNSIYSITGITWSGNFTVLIAGMGYDATGNESTGLWQFDIRSGSTSFYFDFFQIDQTTSKIDWWSDGTVVLSLAPQSGSNSQLWLLKPDARSLFKISESPREKFSPRWSPDGQSILFSDGFSTYQMNPDGTEETLIVGGIWGAVWSPDGSYIAGTQGVEFSYSTELRWFELSTGQQGVIAGLSDTLDWR